MRDEPNNNQIIIFGLQEKIEENYFETLNMVVKWLGDSIRDNDREYQLFSYIVRQGEHPILI
jgi:hypothetical protein